VSVDRELVIFCEALLFVAERPLETREIAEIAGVKPGVAAEVLDTLGRELVEGGRGLRLQRHDAAWQLVTTPEAAPRLVAYASRTEARLSPAALEALAVIAYRQPATRGDVERVRGVDSDSVLRSLLHRRLIVEVGRRSTPGRPILYGTTFTFMERFGLTSLEELAPLSTEAAEVVATAVLVGDDG